MTTGTKMDTEIIKLPIEEFTTTKVDGDGIFDQLMQANKAHLEQEFQKNRIKGPEYATVYLGSLEKTMETALRFFIDGRKSELELELMRAQIALANREIDIAEKRLEMMECEQALCRANILKVNAETDLIEQQNVNAKTENITMQKQQCKLDAEFDLLVLQKGKVGSETALLTQKVATEAAQVSSGGVDPNSVIGRQKALYVAQTDGFQRNAEHQVAKLMADTWAIQRTTDENIHPGEAGFDGPTIKRAINKALSGVQA